MENETLNPDEWRNFARERIEGFRRGSVDFDGLLLPFAVFALMVEAGTANPREPVRAALREFLAAAAVFANWTGEPDSATLEPQLRALLEAIDDGAH